jgi:hypothetical protein
MALNRQSTLDLQNYIQALVTYAEQKSSAADLITFRDALFAKIQTGDGKTMTNSSPGGKSFQFEITMTVEEQFGAVVKAIEIYQDNAGSGSPMTFIDFSRLGGRSSLPCPPPCG